jgi:hypothetical protein
LALQPEELHLLTLHPNHIADKDPGARGIATTTLLAATAHIPAAS